MRLVRSDAITAAPSSVWPPSPYPGKTSTGSVRFINVLPNGAVLILNPNTPARLAEVRAKYPQYKDLSDAALAVKFPAESTVIWDDEEQKVLKAYFEVIDAAVRQQRWSATRYAFLAWIVPVAVLYAFGWSVAWVRRGFHAQQ